MFSKSLFLSFFIFFICFFLSSCKSYTIVPDQNETDIVYVDDITYIQQSIDGVTIFCHLEKLINDELFDNHLMIRLNIKNNSDRSFNFNPRFVQVKGFNKEGQSTFLTVIDPDDFMDSVHAQENFQLFLKKNKILDKEVQSGESYTETVTTHPDGKTTETYTKHYDPEKALRQEQAKKREIRRLKRTFIQKDLQRNHYLLKANTLVPGQQISGIILLDFKRQFSEKYEIKTQALDHDFLFKFNMIEK